MSIFDTIKRLIKGSPDAQAATQHMITVLAAEAVKTGNPTRWLPLPRQWEQLQEGTRTDHPPSEHQLIHKLRAIHGNFTDCSSSQMADQG